MQSERGRLWQCRFQEGRQRLFVVDGLAICPFAPCSLGLAEGAVVAEKPPSYGNISHSFGGGFEGGLLGQTPW